MAQRKFIIDGGFNTDDASELLANLTMGGSILPNVDSDGTTGYDLGSTTAKWRDLYLSEGSLYINNQKVIHDDSGTIVVKADMDQGLTVKTEGTGIITLQSTQTINVAGTLQINDGKNITSSGGTAVGFGDKIDMGSNKIINVPNPTDNGDVANKTYVDLQISNLTNGAPGALDTLNELANALGDDANFSTTVTNNIATNAADIVSLQTVSSNNATALATAQADIVANTTAITAEAVTARANEQANTALINAMDSAYQAADSAINTTVSLKANKTYVDQQDQATLASAQTYADTAEADAVTTAGAYTDTREAAITTAYQAAISSSASSSGSNAEAYTDAEIATATTAITSAYETYADTAEADAVATASADATSKADAARAGAVTDVKGSDLDMGGNKVLFANVYTNDGDLPSASTYHGMFAHVHTGGKAVFAHSGNWVELAKQTDITTAINNLTDSAPGALDTLNELAAALGDDANFATTMTNNLAGKVSTGTTITAGNGLSGGGDLSANRTIEMSGNFTGSFTASGDITAYSDENLKYNIETIDGALGEVEGIRGVTWNRKADDSRATGVVAQELEAVLPEAVHTDAEGMKSVAYGNITGLLIEAVKELSAQVAELKANK